jgi:hypothetical protein
MLDRVVRWLRIGSTAPIKFRPQRLVLAAAIGAIAAGGAGIGAWAQANQQPAIPIAPPTVQIAPPNFKPQQIRQQQIARQKAIQADAAQLLTLAQQLKKEVDRSDRFELSLSVVRDADRIDKLAKKIKASMRDGV